MKGARFRLEWRKTIPVKRLLKKYGRSTTDGKGQMKEPLNSVDDTAELEIN